MGWLLPIFMLLVLLQKKNPKFNASRTPKTHDWWGDASQTVTTFESGEDAAVETPVIPQSVVHQQQKILPLERFEKVLIE